MKKHLVIILLLMSSTSIFSQETEQNVLSSGGDYKENANGSLSWTLGETVTESYNENGLSQGFQQGSISVETSLENTEIDISCFPNPTTNFITLRKNSTEKEFTYMLYSAQGSLLESDILVESKSISFTNYSSGSYILSVKDSEGKEKQFTIQKY